ncbi:Uncharacterized conserved protein YodC, DUF2158 family [Porphyromonadaceae bacterium KH3CP3RA]|nr:Uncharacterized conserved protein YodC, DUF2158 family [Porphyromonadaceae bacterium KH3CP3RA]
MENELKAGDVVVLKSGGPRMTIENIGEYTYEIKALCSWFDNKKRISETFKLEALLLCDED